MIRLDSGYTAFVLDGETANEIDKLHESNPVLGVMVGGKLIVLVPEIEIRGDLAFAERLLEATRP